MADYLPSNTLEPWTPKRREDIDQLTIRTHNRYFSQVSDINESTIIPLGKQVDPHGFLAQEAKRANFVHTTDGEVALFKMITGDKDKK